MSDLINSESNWCEISESIDKIFGKNGKKLSITVREWSKYYNLIHSECTGTNLVNGQNNAANIYKNTKEYLEDYIEDIKKESLSYKGSDLVFFYIKEWKRYNDASYKIHSLYSYINKIFIVKINENKNTLEEKIYPISELCIILWKKLFFKKIKDSLVANVLLLVKNERDGIFFDTNIIKSFVISLLDLGAKKRGISYYNKIFGEEYKLQTDLYYTLESSKYFTGNIVEYMGIVERRFIEEGKRLNNYVPLSLHLTIIINLNNIMIKNYNKEICSEFPRLFNDGKIEDIGRMYALLDKIDTKHDMLVDIFEKKISEDAKKVIESVAENYAENVSKKEPKLLIDSILVIYKKYDYLVKKAFKNDVIFSKCLDKCCRKIVNNNIIANNNHASKTPEILAKYIDSFLKKGSSCSHIADDSNIETIIEDSIIIFNYLEEKDVFMHFYIKDLSIRLIQDTCNSEESEHSMIYKIKKISGSQYTTKIERMFADITINITLGEDFQDYCQKIKIDSKNYSFKVLSSGSWPFSQSSQQLQVPLQLSDKEQMFRVFYDSKYSGRKLTWLHQYSKGEISNSIDFKSMKGNTQTYKFKCNTYQMVVILLFNDHKILKFDQIAKITQLSPANLTNVIKSLLICRILLVDPKIVEGNNTIGLNHRFMINGNFRNPKGDLSIIPKTIETEKENSNAYKTIEEDRSLQIQAAIVRIMKMRKECSHQNLVSEVIPQLRIHFQPKINIIKKCIEFLIDKEYIERIEDKNSYRYLA